MSNGAWEFMNGIRRFNSFKTMNVAREVGKSHLSYLICYR